MSTILGLHGVRNLRPGEWTKAATTLSAIWLRELNRGLVPPLANTDLTMAYYADLIAAAVPRADQQGDSDDFDHLDPQCAAAIRAWARALGVEEEIPQGALGAPLRWLVGTIAQRFGLDHTLVRVFVRCFFAEVTTYMSQPLARTAVRARVAQQIERHQPRVIVAHSLGSVVAYETLWAEDHPPIAVLVTLGSPLAMPDVIFDRLTPTPGGHRRPPGVATWINLADPGDIVATPPRLTPRFAGLTVDRANSTGAFRFHAVGGYLAHPVTATALAPYLDER